jgi:hypothetical protein
MNNVWKCSVEDYIEVIELAKSRGKVAGQSIEQEFLEVMEKKGIKPSGCTELNIDELLIEGASHGQKAMSMETKDGKTIIKTIEKNENNENNTNQ